MLKVMLPGISYPRKTKRNDSDQVSRYSILCEKIRIKLERDANISPQGIHVFKIVILISTYQRSLVSFCLDSIASWSGRRLDARDFQNLTFPATIVLHAKHKFNIMF